MEDRKLYPLRFQPIAEKVSWGGNALRERYGKSFGDEATSPEEPVGESWEVADMGFRDSAVTNGWLAANSLGELMDMYLDRLSGESAFAWYGRQFPLLVKYLDVRGRTPLLVHPDDEVASQRYDALGKAKLWYVMEAGKDARIFLGFKENVSAAQLWEACRDSRIEGLMNAVTPRPGDWFTLPAGLVHGACGPLVMAEVAEASDLDFKIHNWGRPTENDPDEPLTLESALDFIRLEGSDAAADGNALKEGSPARLRLCKFDAFSVTRLRLDEMMRVDSAPLESFLLYQCVSGEVSVQAAETEGGPLRDYRIRSGETLLVPAEVTQFFLVPRAKDCVLLESRVEMREEKDAYTG